MNSREFPAGILKLRVIPPALTQFRMESARVLVPVGCVRHAEQEDNHCYQKGGSGDKKEDGHVDRVVDRLTPIVCRCHRVPYSHSAYSQPFNDAHLPRLIWTGGRTSFKTDYRPSGSAKLDDGSAPAHSAGFLNPIRNPCRARCTVGESQVWSLERSPNPPLRARRFDPSATFCKERTPAAGAIRFLPFRPSQHPARPRLEYFGLRQCFGRRDRSQASREARDALLAQAIRPTQNSRGIQLHQKSAALNSTRAWLRAVTHRRTG